MLRNIVGIGPTDVQGFEMPEEFQIDYAPPYVRKRPILFKTTSPLDLKINAGEASRFRAEELAEDHLLKYPTGLQIGLKVAPSAAGPPTSTWKTGFSQPSLLHSMNARGNSTQLDYTKIQHAFMRGGPISDKIYEENRVGAGIISDNHDPITYALPTKDRQVELILADNNKILSIPTQFKTNGRENEVNLLNQQSNPIDNQPINLSKPIDSSSKNFYLQQMGTTPITNLLGVRPLMNNVKEVEREKVLITTNVVLHDPKTGNYRPVKLPERDVQHIMTTVKQGRDFALATKSGDSMKIRDYTPTIFQPNTISRTLILSTTLPQHVDDVVDLYLVTNNLIGNTGSHKFNNASSKDRQVVSEIIQTNKWINSISPNDLFSIPSNLFKEVRFQTMINNPLEDRPQSIDGKGPREKELNFTTIAPNLIANRITPINHLFKENPNKTIEKLSITKAGDSISQFNPINPKERETITTQYIENLRSDQPYNNFPDFLKKRDLTQKQIFSTKIEDTRTGATYTSVPARLKDLTYSSYTELGYERKRPTDMTDAELIDNMTNPLGGKNRSSVGFA